MTKVNSKTLLKDPRVVDEINKHLWIESEKAGHDIGFEQAADDWIERYSGEWMKNHLEDRQKTKMTRRRARRTKVQ